ncbi:putative Non-histone chromosomal protein 6 [Zopfochytrium polystomum]|nr:putative Non-histone chromosomal protein 6 [Zopfochytrium polystomum]
MPKAKSAKVSTKTKTKAPSPPPAKVARRKKVRDPKAPKKASSAYVFFSNEKRTVVSRTGLSFVDTSKELGRMWRSMDTAQKAPYEALAKADKARYAKEKAAYAGGEAGNDDDEEEESDG